MSRGLVRLVAILIVVSSTLVVKALGIFVDKAMINVIKMFKMITMATSIITIMIMIIMDRLNKLTSMDLANLSKITLGKTLKST